MGFFRNLYDTILYIYRNGWEEYKKARVRYDKHKNAVDNLASRHTKKSELSYIREAQKRARR